MIFRDVLNDMKAGDSCSITRNWILGGGMGWVLRVVVDGRSMHNEIPESDTDEADICAAIDEMVNTLRAHRGGNQG